MSRSASGDTDVIEGRSRDGVPLAIHDLGGAGRAALIAHANGFHGHAYGALARALAGSLHCFAVDLRGHGRSGVREDLDFSWAGHADDVLAAAATIGGTAVSAQAPLGIGHSLGGAALLLAEAARGGTFAGIYCYEPILVPAGERQPPGSDNALARGARARRDRFGSRAEALAHYESRSFFSGVERTVLEDYVEHGFDEDVDGGIRLRCRPESEARTFEAAWASDVVGRLADVACPVVIAVGGRSRDVGRRWALAGAASLPDARILEIEGLGHLGPFEDPRRVAASVREFAATLRN